MPTNDERREVAARLREPYPRFTNLVDAFGLTAPVPIHELRYRLADLIEPEERTCRNISTVPCKFTCSECHQSWREAKGNGAFAYCPCCGAMVMDQ